MRCRDLIFQCLFCVCVWNFVLSQNRCSLLCRALTEPLLLPPAVPGASPQSCSQEGPPPQLPKDESRKAAGSVSTWRTLAAQGSEPPSFRSCALRTRLILANNSVRASNRNRRRQIVSCAWTKKQMKEDEKDPSCTKNGKKGTRETPSFTLELF